MNAREAFANQFGITKQQLQVLMYVYGATDLFTCLELIKAKKHRSPFRADLARQLRMWLKTHESISQSDARLAHKPLSPQQLKAAMPKWPVHYQIPHEVEVA